MRHGGWAGPIFPRPSVLRPSHPLLPDAQEGDGPLPDDSALLPHVEEGLYVRLG